MTQQSPRRSRSLLGIATVALGLIAIPAMTQAQMQKDQSGQGAMAGSATFKLGDLTVTSPWTRATPGGAKVAGGYLKITNNGTAPDRFVGATSDTAGRVEIHEMSMNDGVMKMRPLPDGLEIKPGETIELKSGGYHLMFMDIKPLPSLCDPLKAKLQFEKAGSVDVTFSVLRMDGSPCGLY